jgi:hypothetical protein
MPLGLVLGELASPVYPALEALPRRRGRMGRAG